MSACETDFRQDLAKIDVPVLIVQGDADRILPFPKTGKRLPGLIKEIELVVIEGGPHAIAWTHADQVNDALVWFIDAHAAAIAAEHLQHIDAPVCRGASPAAAPAGTNNRPINLVGDEMLLALTLESREEHT